MEKIVKEYKVMREDLKDLSDETAALLLVAKKLDVIASKASILDPEQLVILTEKMDGIATALHGVGEMVRESSK